MDIKKLLADLTNMAGPSGFEADVAEYAAELMRPFVDEVTVDKLGNAFGIRRASVMGAKKLMLSAHLDEIGFMVTGIEEGFLSFRTLGGIDPRVIPAREVTVLTDPPMYGVVCAFPPHLQTAEEMKIPYPIEKLYIDVGLRQEKALKLIPIGTPIVYREKFVELNDRLVSGKTMDDRACFAILLRTLELLQGRDLGVELIIQASVQEEVGARGAQVGAYAYEPDYAIAVDVTHAHTPDAAKDRTVKMEGGVPISMGPNTSLKLAKHLMRLADKNEIKWQAEVMEGRTGTDAWPMQVVRKGVATAIVSLPLKYMHTSTELVSLSDIEDAAKLLAELALSFEGGAL